MTQTPIDYRPAATLHRPDDPDILRREAGHLIALGLTHDDVAACLGLTKAAVRQLLNPSSTERNTQ
jgi:predicted transcriptional regulator